MCTIRTEIKPLYYMYKHIISIVAFILNNNCVFTVNNLLLMKRHKVMCVFSFFFVVTEVIFGELRTLYGILM